MDDKIINAEATETVATKDTEINPVSSVQTYVPNVYEGTRT